MQRFKQVVIVCLCFYLLYEVKSAMEIDISKKYHAIDLVKIPAKYVVQNIQSLVCKLAS
jgi:hypothetical protein